MENKQMTIVAEWPPNIEKIKRVFDLTGKKPCFCYGNILYNPYNSPISVPLMTHEATHMQQQGDNPEAWWNRYLVDSQFRMMEEVEAYGYQYMTYCKMDKNRNSRAIYLHRIATDLSSPMYGNMISYTLAIQTIRNGTKNHIQ